MATKNSFWNSCPRKLDFFPDGPCHLGKSSVSSKDPEKGCQWHINSEADQYCFWTWVRRVSDKDGFIEPLLQHEMSELLGISSTKIHAIYKEVAEKIKESPEFSSLRSSF